jgi:hypothetical protein
MTGITVLEVIPSVPVLSGVLPRFAIRRVR